MVHGKKLSTTDGRVRKILTNASSAGGRTSTRANRLVSEERVNRVLGAPAAWANKAASSQPDPYNTSTEASFGTLLSQLRSPAIIPPTVVNGDPIIKYFFVGRVMSSSLKHETFSLSAAWHHA